MITCSAGGLAGALSRTATAPMDRLRMLQQVHRGSGVLSMRQVGRPPARATCSAGHMHGPCQQQTYRKHRHCCRPPVFACPIVVLTRACPVLQGLAKMAAEGTVRAFWRGNGTNVAKNIPEMVCWG